MAVSKVPPSDPVTAYGFYWVVFAVVAVFYNPYLSLKGLGSYLRFSIGV